MRLWITGVGLVTPLALGAEATWTRLLRGERAAAPITRFDTTSYRAALGCEVKGLEACVVPTASGGLVAAGGGAWSRTARMAYVAAEEAIAASGLDVRAARVGLVVGGTTGGMLESEELLGRVHADPARHEELAELLSHPLWATSDRLAETLGPFARVRTVSSACSSGANALVVAAAWLLSGEVDAVVAGGTDGLCRLTLAGFNALAATDPEPCKPFDARRRGLNLGEGAGFVVLEPGDRARARQRTPVAELAGWALGAEAHHVTNPDPSGDVPARVIGRALARAGIEPRAVDYVNAHGTGTPKNDPMECAAIARALRPGVVVSSAKGQIGHTLAAAGAIEAALTALVVAKQAVGPTAGLAEIDPECASVVHVMGEGRAMRVRVAVSNSFGFGGMDTALVVTEPELGREHAPSRRSVVVTGAVTLASAELPALEAALDVERARRLDRPAKIAAIAVGRALDSAGPLDPAAVGVVLGSTFGNLDASAAFIHRLFEKGPRLVSPADFPNLVPSAAVGHASIYLGLRGPVLAVSELGAAGECAVMQAAELVAAGEADVVAAGDAAESHGSIERVIAALFAGPRRSGHGVAEDGAAVVLEDEAHATARGARILARVVALETWQAEDRPPALGEDAEEEAPGAFAVAAAASRIAAGVSREERVVGVAGVRGYAVVLAAAT